MLGGLGRGSVILRGAWNRQAKLISNSCLFASLSTVATDDEEGKLPEDIMKVKHPHPLSPPKRAPAGRQTVDSGHYHLADDAQFICHHHVLGQWGRHCSGGGG